MGAPMNISNLSSFTLGGGVDSGERAPRRVTMRILALVLLRKGDITSLQTHPGTSEMSHPGTSKMSGDAPRMPEWASERVRDFWHLVESRLGTARAPSVIEASDDDCLTLHWEKGAQRLQLDFWRDGTLEWFFYDPEDGTVDGSDGLALRTIPGDFLQRLTTIAN